jgi:hypothetical protein
LFALWPGFGPSPVAITVLLKWQQFQFGHGTYADNFQSECKNPLHTTRKPADNLLCRRSLIEELPKVQAYSDVALSNAVFPGITSPLPELTPSSETELEFSALALISLMDDSWPDDWHG